TRLSIDPTGSISHCAASQLLSSECSHRGSSNMLTRAPRGYFDSLGDSTIQALARGRLSDPFAFLGPHETPHGRVVRAFLPGAESVDVLSRGGESLLGQLTPVKDGLFSGAVRSSEPYVLRIQWPSARQETEDPYSFGLVLGDLDLHLFSEGAHWELAERFGA